MLANNISIELEDVANHMTPEIDGDKLIQAIRTHQPTVLFLAFCFTQVSQLNELLRSAGLYMTLMVQEDHNTLTEGRYATLDPSQRKVMEQMSKEEARNLFLYGSHGTGKTLILCQVLLMKMASYKRQDRRVRVIASTWKEDSKLLKDFQEIYLPILAGDETVRIIPIQVLCNQHKIEYIYSNPILVINSLTAALAMSGIQTVLLVDDVSPVGKKDTPYDWTAIKTYPTVDCLLACNPGSNHTQHHTMTPPNTTTVAHHLLSQHINCQKIGDFLLFIKTHVDKCSFSNLYCLSVILHKIQYIFRSLGSVH